MSEELDWSLKGKEVKSIHIKHADGTIIEITFPYFCTVFPKEDIGTLREKLIEDLDSIDCTDNKGALKGWQIVEEALEVIDKRFGVEK